MPDPWDRHDALAWLADRTDPRTIAALTRTCSICAAKPGRDCYHPWKDAPVMNRIVHQARAQAHMDKR